MESSTEGESQNDGPLARNLRKNSCRTLSVKTNMVLVGEKKVNKKKEQERKTKNKASANTP